MPWTIEVRDDEWCVIGPDGTNEGCHASRAQALAQQRALYAQEAKTASGNGHPVLLELPAPQAAKVELVSVPHPLDEVLVASVVEIQERLERTESILAGAVDALGKMLEAMQHDRETFRAALTAAAQQPTPEVTVNVPEPVVNVTVPEASVNVAPAPAPVVNIEMPASHKTVTFTRNLQGEIEQAEIVEEGHGG